MTAPQPKQWKCDQCGRETSFGAEFDQVWCQIPHDRPGDCQGFLRALAVTAAQPTPDSRVEKLAAYIRGHDFRDAGEQGSQDYARLEIREVEAAGLLVLDPDDALEKILRSLSLDRMSSSYMEMAANILAALRGSR